MQNRIEEYLETVERRLGVLPPAQRQNEISEMRDHIETMVAAHQELGAGEEEAVKAALAQFGDADTVGQKLTQAVRRGQERLPGNLITGAVSTYVCLWGVGLALFHLLFRLQNNGMHLRFYGDVPLQAVPLPAILTAIIGGAVFVCLAAGFITGAIFPRKAIPGIALAYLFGFAMHLYAIYHLPPVGMPARLTWYVCTCGSWILATLLSTLGAKAGTRWRTTIRRRRMDGIIGPQSV